MAKKLYEENDIRALANSIREKTGSSDSFKLSEMITAVTNIPSGKKYFDGSCDVDGLTYMGWTTDDIDNFKKNGLCWNEEQNDLFKVNDDEKNGFVSNDNRFVKKICSPLVLKNKSNLIGVPELSTEVTSASNLFSGCSCLLYAPKLNITSTNCNNIFYLCSSLRDVHNFYAPNATNLYNAFSYCYSLRDLDDVVFSNNITEINYMFQNCYALIKAPNINTSNVKEFSNVFSNCISLVDVPVYKTNSITSANSTFNGCSTLKYLKFGDSSQESASDYEISVNFDRFCSGCKSLLKVDLSNLGKYCKAYGVSSMFSGCTSLQFIDIRTLDCAHITNSNRYLNTLNNVPYIAKIIVADSTQKTWWQTNFSDWSSCFYTVEEAIAAGIVDE